MTAPVPLTEAQVEQMFSTLADQPDDIATWSCGYGAARRIYATITALQAELAEARIGHDADDIAIAAWVRKTVAAEHRAASAESSLTALRTEVEGLKERLRTGIYSLGTLQPNGMAVLVCKSCGEWDDSAEHIKHLPTCEISTPTSDQ